MDYVHKYPKSCIICLYKLFCQFNAHYFSFDTYTPDCRKPIEHFLKALDEVSLDDITKYANKLISSPLTMASWGNSKSPNSL